MIEDLSDPRRREPPYVLGDRAMLEAWLEFHRTTLLLKCEGLDDAARKASPVPTSKLSLHGLVRHMAEVERGWFRRTLLRRGAPRIWIDPAIDDADSSRSTTPTGTWTSPSGQAECEASRAAAAAHELDDHSGVRDGEPCTLRWIYVHMIEEYARHNGHADLIREMVDGNVGW